MAQVDLHDVEKIYTGGVRAVDGFNLSIADGEFVVLVGPSGCGKSTTLRMVAGLEEITGGEVKIGDRIVNEVPPKDRDIAMVFQNYALFPHMTVKENLAFPLKVRKLPNSEIESKIKRALGMVQLEGFQNRRPMQLSGGQQHVSQWQEHWSSNPAWS